MSKIVGTIRIEFLLFTSINAGEYLYATAFN